MCNQKLLWWLNFILWHPLPSPPPPPILIVDNTQLLVSRGRVVVRYKTGNPGYEGSILLKFLIFFIFWTATHVLSNKTLGFTQFQQVSQLHPWWCKCQIKHQLRRKWITVYLSAKYTYSAVWVSFVLPVYPAYASWRRTRGRGWIQIRRHQKGNGILPYIPFSAYVLLSWP